LTLGKTGVEHLLHGGVGRGSDDVENRSPELAKRCECGLAVVNVTSMDDEEVESEPAVVARLVSRPFSPGTDTGRESAGYAVLVQ
jgi:hypothetical protein